MTLQQSAQVSSRLTEVMGKDMTEFFEKSHAVLSGSFLVDALIEEHGNKNDIDLYIHMNQERYVLTYFLEHFGAKIEPPIYDFQRRYYGSSYAYTIHINDHLDIFLIVIKDLDENNFYSLLQQALTHDYDLDICANLYDSQHLYVHQPAHLNEGKAFFQPSANNYECILECHPNFQRRLEKYSQRGFQFEQIEWEKIPECRHTGKCTIPRWKRDKLKVVFDYLEAIGVAVY